MLNILEFTSRARRASGLIAALAIWTAVPVWAQCPVNESVKLTASDSAIADGFGKSVSVSGDTAIVGARGVDDDCPSPNPPQIPDDRDCGAAYIFQVDTDGTWIQVARLTAADAEAFDEFGYSVSISGDTAIVGAHRSNEVGIHSGSASIFRRDFGGPDNWGEVVEFVGSDTAPGDLFGRSVSISGDTALVGAPFHDHIVPNSAAYIFQRDAGGPENWGQVAELTASDPTENGFLGWFVSLSGDTAIVGAWGGVGDGGIESGSAYIFQRDFGGPGNWGQMAKLTASDAHPSDWFGFSVAVSGDIALVGAPQNDDAGGALCSSGSAYIFQRNFGGADHWGEVVKLIASDAVCGDFLGVAVTLSGNTAIAGASGDDTMGSAYIFQRDLRELGGADHWTEVGKLTASDAGLSDNFGAAVSFDGETALVGAWFDDDGGSNSGSAYLFDCVSVVQTIIPTSQQRSTDASVSYEQCGNQSTAGDTAEGFDPFDSAVETQLACGKSSAQVGAGQQSQIDASSMAGSGHTFLETTGPDSGDITAAGDSLFEVTFELQSIMAFALDGFIIAGRHDPNDNLQVGATITLTGPDRQIIFSHSVSAGTHNTIDEVGALPPGLYTLVAAAEIGIEGKVSGAAMGESSFEFAIDFALLGDLDVDGDVDLVDFANWVDCFTGPDNGPYPLGCRAFDFDIDNDVDSADFAVFQIAFTGN